MALDGKAFGAFDNDDLFENTPELNNMINKKALINQHIYEIEKLRHDLIVTQTKNGLYLSEDRQTEIRHKSENKSGNLVDSRRKIELIR
ncbi:hypothetical protein BY996DRAFT_6464031 [Phakopsora pachyrhizi]|nr:hypothetical protein BY996DRAFT_6562367 [Phakopsora pachyrhizi]KAI8457297.1 hypothetical protein BY996DRAFT_6464031 [Phakopsora pachyrhizi]